MLQQSLSVAGMKAISFLSIYVRTPDCTAEEAALSLCGGVIPGLKA